MTANKRLTIAIMLALAVWGLYLAVGATGYFTDVSLLDARKSFVVAISMTSFLVMWVFVLRAVEKRKSLLQAPAVDTAEPESEISESNKPESAPTSPPAKPWSKAGIATMAIGAIGAVLWGVSIVSFESVGLVTTTILGWLVAISMVGAATAGMVALSNPRPLRGKWLGLCGLLQGVLALIFFVIRMTP